MNLKSWEVKPLDRNMAVEIAEEYEIPTVLSILLEQRTKGDHEKIEELLSQDDFYESPFEILDMDKACERIKKAVDNFERIVIYGDYDADGITSTAILFNYFQTIGADVMYYIPEREGEGYGMNTKAIDYLSNYDVKLIVTVDNGIASVKEVDHANSLGIDVIITDHHKPQEVLPNALAVVNPHRKDCQSIYKDYCGAGIALKLVMALDMDFDNTEEAWLEYVDLASIGTVADIVPLTGENRVIVKKGMEKLINSDKIGINELVERAGISKVNSSSLAFSLVPRINAAGRMGSADRAVRLLSSDDEEEARLYAEDLCTENDNRRHVETQILEQAILKIESNPEIKYSRVIVVDGEDWHGGVIGIVASKILEKYGKPVMVISYNGNEAKGSGRSFGEFSLFDALNASKETLVRFGGHPAAAGISIETGKIQEFRAKINEYAKHNFDKMPVLKQLIDLKLQPAALSIDIPEQVKILEPFGKDNESPVFGLYNMKLEGITAVGSQKNHLRLIFSRDRTKISTIMFSCTEDKFPYELGDVLDLAVNLDINEYNGNRNLSIMVRNIKPSKINVDLEIDSYAIYEKVKRNEPLTKYEQGVICPIREEIAVIYRYIREKNKSKFSALQILNSIPPSKINLAKLLVSLEALSESNLIKLNIDEFLEIELIKAKTKVDIEQARIITKIKGLSKQ